MTGAPMMDIERDALLAEPAGRPGMIEVDVGHKNRIQFAGMASQFGQFSEKLISGRFRPCFDENLCFAALDEKSSDGVTGVLKLKIDRVNLHFAPT